MSRRHQVYRFLGNASASFLLMVLSNSHPISVERTVADLTPEECRVNANLLLRASEYVGNK